MEEDKTNGNGIAALICGILSIVIWIVPYIALPLGIIAVVFATKQKKIKQTGQATAGQVLGIIGIVLNAVLLLLVLLFFFVGMSTYKL